MASAWGASWWASWGNAWGQWIAEIIPIVSAPGHNAPPLSRVAKRRGVNRRRLKIQEDRRIARRQAEEDVLLLL